MARRSKNKEYEEFLGKLPRYEVDEAPARRAQIDKAQELVLKDMDDKPTVPALVKSYIAAREAKEALEQEIKTAGIILDAVQELMVQQFEQEGVDSMRTREGLVSIYVEPYTSVSDPDALREWAEAQGLHGSLQLPWGSVNSITKQLLEDGQPQPDGVKVFAKTKIRLERSR